MDTLYRKDGNPMPSPTGGPSYPDAIIHYAIRVNARSNANTPTVLFETRVYASEAAQAAGYAPVHSFNISFGKQGSTLAQIEADFNAKKTQMTTEGKVIPLTYPQVDIEELGTDVQVDFTEDNGLVINVDNLMSKIPSISGGLNNRLSDDWTSVEPV